jgi:hypothetical protein
MVYWVRLDSAIQKEVVVKVVKHGEEYVVMEPIEDGKGILCDWVSTCPTSICKLCPANGNQKEYTYQEAVEFFEKN